MLLLKSKCSVAVFGKGREAIPCGEAAPSRAYTGSGLKRGREQFAARECSVAVLRRGGE